MAPPPRPRLVLFSGLGVDARLVQAQRPIAADIEVPPWIAPLEGEPLAAYARRFAQQLDWSRPAFVGGISFGGMVAQEVARHVPALGLVLLATCRSAGEIPLPYRVACGIGRHTPAWIIGSSRVVATRLKGLMGLVPSEHLAWFDAMIADTDPAFLKWAAGAMLGWRGAGEPRVPTIQIQGTRDLILPARLTSPTHRIAQAGHLANVTHATQINAIVQGFMSGVSARIVRQDEMPSRESPVPSPATAGEG